jgi:hypothetical protein
MARLLPAHGSQAGEGCRCSNDALRSSWLMELLQEALLRASLQQRLDSRSASKGPQCWTGSVARPNSHRSPWNTEQAVCNARPGRWLTLVQGVADCLRRIPRRLMRIGVCRCPVQLPALACICSGVARECRNHVLILHNHNHRLANLQVALTQQHRARLIPPPETSETDSSSTLMMCRLHWQAPECPGCHQVKDSVLLKDAVQ